MIKEFTRWLATAAVAGGVVTLTCSCNHYTRGLPSESSITIALPFKSIYVQPVKNNSFAPQAQVLLTNQLMQGFAEAGIPVKKNPEDAGAILQVTLEHYKSYVAATKSADTFLGNSFHIDFLARVTLTGHEGGNIYLCNEPVSAEITALASEGTQEIIFHDMPALTQKLADNIKDLVLSPW